MSFNNFIVYLFYIFVLAESLTEALVNTEVHRSIDISSQLVLINYNISVQNDYDRAELKYDFIVEEFTRKSLAYIEAYTLFYSSRIKLKVEEVEDNESDGTVLWKINFRQPLKIGCITKLQILCIFTHQIHPYPTHIHQSENQLVKYNGNFYFYSPYLTVKQTSVVICSSDKFENYSKLPPTSQSNNVIVYGPYDNVRPFTFKIQEIHYENNEVFLTISNMERVIEISHWGKITVEETVELQHTGAILKGPFSRLDYHSEDTDSISGITTILPAAAEDIYYRDIIGNVSSSKIRVLNDLVELHLKFRFPLFGGWKISYMIGYTVPTYEYLYNDGEDFILKMRVVDHVYDNMVIDELITKIILPEYCSDIWLFTPYTMVQLPETKHYSYVDIAGRSVVTVSKNNIVENHIQNFELQYTFFQKKMIIEPLILICLFFANFVLVILFNRIDISISKGDELSQNVCTNKRKNLKKVNSVHK